jgi:hypothetical protein
MAYSATPQRLRKPVTSYSGCHDLVRATLGDPSAHGCTETDCTSAAQEWALLPFFPGTVRMTYGPHADKAFNPDPRAYTAMCRSHHRRLDFIVRTTVKGSLTVGQVAA